MPNLGTEYLMLKRKWSNIYLIYRGKKSLNMLIFKAINIEMKEVHLRFHYLGT